MKNLFNNPWFIGALGAFAMIYLGVVLVGPMLGESDGSGVIADDAAPLGLNLFGDDPGEAPAGGSELVNRELAVDKRSEISWLNDVDRDPFTGTLIGEVSGDADSDALPRLAALFVGKGVKAAVLNDRLVRVGDEVSRYRVTAIGAEHVLVQRAGRYYRLEPGV